MTSSADSPPAANVTMTPADARAAFRGGRVVPTAGYCAGFAQANLLAVPADYAFEMLLFAQRNPKSCPVLGVLEAGAVSSELLAGGDIRTDIPRYRIYHDGDLTAEPTDVLSEWREDLVSFLIGCSFTFEAALLTNDVPVAHIEQDVNVPMYRTSVPTVPAGRFSGPLVVSMRPIPADRVADAVRITARYPSVHGAPVHIGEPGALGIADLGQPDFGDPVEIAPDSIPVFWACGVTPQAAVMASGTPLAIAHAPGYMLITDARDAAYQIP
ncbi:MAG TPA: putative hydro-lyase [Candidatus Nesterenkonia stercoripullorum]|uniref:Putative hydro-lyase H9871_07295 n=1 Tax=Candidatus Nesterenkonia stercoripullorum TaxID=2838701 RepID=A0A9D2A8C6_9MICC|nr:putative hydro-lyase [Candidatus Nesterenkonia stercoripullorum]